MQHRPKRTARTRVLSDGGNARIIEALFGPKEVARRLGCSARLAQFLMQTGVFRGVFYLEGRGHKPKLLRIRPDLLEEYIARKSGLAPKKGGQVRDLPVELVA